MANVRAKHGEGVVLNIQLSKLEKVLIATYILVVISMLLNPPWAYFHPETGKFIRSLGEGNVFDGGPEAEAQIHFSVLLYRIVVTTFLFAIIGFTLRKFKAWKDRSKDTKSIK